MAKIFLLLLSMTLFAAQGVLIPFYHYPLDDDEEIAKLLAYKKAYPDIEFFVIINPANGDFRAEQYNFASLIDKLHEANITTLGYVYTKYAARDPKEVRLRIDAWAKFYKKWGVEGIFFDEVNSSQEAFSYYEALARYAKKRFRYVVLNPGTKPHKSYMQIADIVVLHESYRLPTQKEKCDKGALLLYGIADLNTTTSLFSQFGYVYVTDRNGSNPWESLSSHMDELLYILQQRTRVFQ